MDFPRLLAISVLLAATAQPHSTGDSYRRARAPIDRALQVMGTPDRIGQAGGIAVEASGTLNKGAEYQGSSPDAVDAGSFREALAVESTDGRVAYSYREDRYDGTYESVQEIYPGGDERLIVLPDARQVIPLHAPDHRSGRLKLARRIPQLLLAELMYRPASLRWLARRDGLELIAGALTTGETLTLAFEDETGVLARVEYLTDVQGFGDAEVVWRFEDYAPVDGIGLFPRRYGVSNAGRPFTDMRVTRVSAGPPAGLAPPAEFTRMPPAEIGAGGDASRDAGVEEIAPGIRRVTRLRQGFHPMFVEFADFVVALDAPGGYRLLNELPAGDVAPGASSAWLSERYIDLIKRAVPGKPIRYVVITHFHNDHLGGVRAFVAEGATVLAAPDAAAVVERLVRAPHTLAPDRLARAPVPLRLEVVEDRRTLTDGRQTLNVVDVGTNPHGREMLVAHLPRARLMFVSDLVTPVALERYPLPTHEALDRFFGRWLQAEGMDPERVFTMHGSGLATRAHLERLRARP